MTGHVAPPWRSALAGMVLFAALVSALAWLPPATAPQGAGADRIEARPP